MAILPGEKREPSSNEDADEAIAYAWFNEVEDA